MRAEVTMKTATFVKPRSAVAADHYAPIHPGEILLTEFLEPLDLSQTRLALAMEVPPRRVNEIVLGKRAITADTAVRLSRAFGTSAQFWLNLQTKYDLETLEADRGDQFARIQRVKPLTESA
jgi:antitoxin HigA-1